MGQRDLRLRKEFLHIACFRAGADRCRLGSFSESNLNAVAVAYRPFWPCVLFLQAMHGKSHNMLFHPVKDRACLLRYLDGESFDAVFASEPPLVVANASRLSFAILRIEPRGSLARANPSLSIRSLLLPGAEQMAAEAAAAKRAEISAATRKRALARGNGTHARLLQWRAR